MYTSAEIPMLNDTSTGRKARHAFRLFSFLIALAILISTTQAFGQQNYVGRFDAYAGYMYLNSPHINLGENGFHIQTGVRVVRWMSLGFDHSRGTGDTIITPDMLLPALQQSLGAQLAALVAAGKIPPTYVLTVPISSVTQTITGGPQFSYHRWKAITPFIRPAIGMIHEVATTHPGDPIAAAIVAQLAPGGTKEDWTKFIGVGGGADLNITRHFALRLSVDIVRDHLFNDLLKDARNTVRFSIGPALQFGKNVRK